MELPDSDSEDLYILVVGESSDNPYTGLELAVHTETKSIRIEQTERMQDSEQPKLDTRPSCELIQVKIEPTCSPEATNEPTCDPEVKIEPEDLEDKEAVQEVFDGWEVLNEALVNEYMKEMQAHASLLKPSVPRDAYKEMGNRYKCVYCKALNNNKYSAVRHYRSHHGDRHHKCLACHEVFRRTDILYGHESVCQAETADLVRLARQKFNIYKTRNQMPRKVRRAIKVPCTVCGKMICNANMKLHLQVHSEIKKYCCSHCSARFRTKRAVQAHLNAHSGTRPYRCDQCPRAYTSDTALRAHKMDHGEKIYQCEYCKRAYSRKHTLKLHLATHSDGREYLCTECGKVFHNKYGLDAHTRKHRDAPTKFSCTDCGKKYSKMTGLNVHMKKKHGHQIVTRKMFFNSLPLMVDVSALLVDDGEASDNIDDPDAVFDLEAGVKYVVDKDVIIPEATEVMCHGDTDII